MKTFEKVMRKMHERNNKPQHVVFRYNFTMEESRSIMIDAVRAEKTMSFEKIFSECDNKIHAIFLFLSILELVQQQYFSIMVGEGKNNLIVEWNENRPPETDFSFGMADPILN
jgi:segregation and condensation protein A